MTADPVAQYAARQIAAQLGRDAAHHAGEAQRLLDESKTHGPTSLMLGHILAEAQVHATLALVAVTAQGTTGATL